MDGLMALAYGAWLVLAGWSRHRLTGQRLPLAGAGGVGGLTAFGGLLMVLGADWGRGVAILSTLLASLFFLWMLSRSLSAGKPSARDAAVVAVSIFLIVTLVRGAPPEAGP